MADHPKVVDLKDAPVELVIDLVPEQGGDLIVDGASSAVAPSIEEEAMVPVDGATAADLLANTEIPAEIGVATAELVAALPNAVDLVDDAQAAALVTRRRMDAQRMNNEVGVEPEEQPPPQNLPAVLGTSVFAKGTAKAPSVHIRWLKVYDLPGYMVRPIRALGRAIFSSFACFAEQQRDAGARGEDPLGDLQILANINGMGPSQRAELDVVATWIRQGGVPVDATTFEFPGVIPGYMPRVILSVSDDRSFLMVEERRDAGAPSDAIYIYSWRGGLRFYRQNADLLANLADRVDANRVGQPRREIPAVRRLGRKAPRQAPEAVAQMESYLSAPVMTEPDAKERRAVRERLPEAPGRPIGGLANELRRAGYWPQGGQNPPHLRKTLDDGRVVDLTVDDTPSGNWVYEIRSADGEFVAAGAFGSIEDLDGAINPRAPSP